MKTFSNASEEPLWRDEFSVRSSDERYVSRRQLTRFLVLTSFGMFVGNLWILVRSWFSPPAEAPYPSVAVARLGEIPVDGIKIFNYPGPRDNCILVRTAPDQYVAYSQKCTHLSCAVYYAPGKKRLECPCHEGYFKIENGDVIQGPPTRPLPKILLEQRGEDLVAVGVDLNTGA